jgi:DNA helicase-2/ATP-dependent DNA helicase PcrA
MALRAWDSLEGTPLATRLAEYARWVAGKAILPGIGGFGKDWLAQGRLVAGVQGLLPNVRKPETLVASLWEEAFIRLDRLREGAERHCPGEFSPAQLEEIRDWCLRAYSQREEYRAWREEWQGQPATDEEGQALRVEPPPIDQEDDTLLLLLFAKMVGPLRTRKNKALRLQHLMIDEAQDFSPLDVQLAIALAAEPRSVTLAGDTDQRMILHNAFDTWEDVLSHLGLKGSTVTPLQVGYRSTEEIMHFSKSVLGELATERPWLPTREGAPVELLRFTDPGQAVSVLSEALHGLLRREPNAYVALIARYPAQAEVYYEGLHFAGLPRLRRVAEQNFTFQRGIDVTDVQQVKGLEFDYVVLLDVDRPSYPDDPAARYLLHIAATRAAHQLWLVTCNAPSPLLPSDLGQQIL